MLLENADSFKQAPDLEGFIVVRRRLERAYGFEAKHTIARVHLQYGWQPVPRTPQRTLNKQSMICS